MATPNENNGAGAPGAGEGGNGAGDQEFELDDKGQQVLDENGKPKPKTGNGNGEGERGNRAPETPEAKYARLNRETEQLLKKNPGLKKPAESEPAAPAADKKGELDLGSKAYLMQNDIKTPEEMKLVQDALKANPGMTIETIITNGYFLAQLKDHRDTVAAEDASPSGKRNGQAAKDTVEYWVAEGGLPENTPANQKLRQDIVAARSKKAGAGTQFTANPVGNASPR